MVGKTQQESEQGVKVYQLDAVESKVDSIQSDVKLLLIQTSTFVTASQLEANRLEAIKYADNIAKEVDLKYEPMKKNLTWFTRTTIGLAIGVVVQGIVLFAKLGG